MRTEFSNIHACHPSYRNDRFSFIFNIESRKLWCSKKNPLYINWEMRTCSPVIDWLNMKASSEWFGVVCRCLPFDLETKKKKNKEILTHPVLFLHILLSIRFNSSKLDKNEGQLDSGHFSLEALCFDWFGGNQVGLLTNQLETLSIVPQAALFTTFQVASLHFATSDRGDNNNSNNNNNQRVQTVKTETEREPFA